MGGKPRLVEEVQYRGQGLRDVVRLFASAFPDFRYEVEDVIAEADKVAVRDVSRGTHQGDFMSVPATGNRVTMEAIHVCRLSEGKLAEHWVARDDLGMMRRDDRGKQTEAAERQQDFEDWGLRRRCSQAAPRAARR